MNVELPSGAKVFIRPEQYRSVLKHIKENDLELKPRHIVISAELETRVTDVINATQHTY